MGHSALSLLVGSSSSLLKCAAPVPFIYLDHNATTPLRPEVRAAMVAALDLWGNPSSIHGPGRQARDAVERARRAVAELVEAAPEEIVFTSGGTEGDNLAIRGLALAARDARRATLAGPAHVISSTIEHPAVQGALDELAREGFAVTRLPVDGGGQLDPGVLAAALRAETVLVSIAAANHELGTIPAIGELASVARARGALFHTDAVQAAGRISFGVGRGHLDAVTLSAHKLHGPKGVGAIYVRRGLALHPLVTGGHQERERRAGTENLVGIVGFGEACRLARADGEERATHIAGLRDRLEERLLAISGARVHGCGRRVPGTLNVGFEGAEGGLVLVGLDLEGICVSTGAACTSGSLAPSPVLLALGLPPDRAREAVRFSLGRDTTVEEIDRAAEVTAAVVARVRASALPVRG
jgi:cysteine desulfurase